VIGKVTPETARAVIEKHFGRWTADGPPPPTDLPPVPLNGPAVVRVPNDQRVQDNVTLAETIGLNRFDPDYYALELGNSVLGGSFYATRLYRDLRQNAGLVYFVSSAIEAGKTRGLYVVAYGSDPANVAKARGIVVRELTTMQTVAVPDHELRLAKAILLRSIPLSESSMDRIARGLTSRAAAGLPLDEPTRAAARYLALTPEDVRAAFAKWIRPQDLVQVTEGPNPLESDTVRPTGLLAARRRRVRPRAPSAPPRIWTLLIALTGDQRAHICGGTAPPAAVPRARQSGRRTSPAGPRWDMAPHPPTREYASALPAIGRRLAADPSHRSSRVSRQAPSPARAGRPIEVPPSGIVPGTVLEDSGRTVEASKAFDAF
jgi:hypothetical protein